MTAATRLATARAALRAHLSPVMSRDHDERDRLCAEVDAAKAEHDLAVYLDAIRANDATDNDATFLAMCLAGAGFTDDVRAAAHEQVAAERIAAEEARDAAAALDFSVEAMATSSTRAKASKRAA